MKDWQVHWLEASGDLSQHRNAIQKGLELAYDALRDWGQVPRLDILIRKNAYLSGGGLDVVGYGYSPALFEISLGREAEFASDLLRDEIARTALHETHHCLRMTGPGYGTTLGEALVTEGLAGQFVRHLLANEPEPWERVIDLETLRKEPVPVATLNSTDYLHHEWFFGQGLLPKWFGYSLGYQMVGSWLGKASPIDRHQWINVAASEVIDAAVAGGLAVR